MGSGVLGDVHGAFIRCQHWRTLTEGEREAAGPSSRRRFQRQGASHRWNTLVERLFGVARLQRGTLPAGGSPRGAAQRPRTGEGPSVSRAHLTPRRWPRGCRRVAAGWCMVPGARPTRGLQHRLSPSSSSRAVRAQGCPLAAAAWPERGRSRVFVPSARASGNGSANLADVRDAATLRQGASSWWRNRRRRWCLCAAPV